MEKITGVWDKKILYSTYKHYLGYVYELGFIYYRTNKNFKTSGGSFKLSTLKINTDDIFTRKN